MLGRRRSFLKTQGFCFIGDILGAVRFDDKATSPFIRGDFFQIAKTGIFHSPVYGRIEITPGDLATMLRNFKTKTPLPPTQLPVDYDHLSDEPKQPEDGKAAGWVLDLELRDDGNTLWCKADWTKRAAQLIAEGAYRFVSPFFLTDYTDKATGKKIGPTLKAVAITNRPFLEGMQPIPAPAIAFSEKLADQFKNEPRVARAMPHSDKESSSMAQEAIAAADAPVPPAPIPPPMPPAGPGQQLQMMAAPPQAPPVAPPPAMQAGGIHCPHCGAPVKYATAPPVAPPPVAPPADAAPPVEGGTEKEAPTEEGSTEDAPKEEAPVQEKKDGMDESGGDADGLDELEKKLMDPTADVSIEACNDDKGTAMSDTQTPVTDAAKLAEENRQLREQLDAAQRKLSETEAEKKSTIAQRLLDIGLRSGRLTKKLIGTAEKPGWAFKEAHRDHKAFQAWLEAAPKVWEGVSEDGKPQALGVGVATESNTAVAFSEKVHKLATEKMASTKGLSYTEATRIALRENPSLSKEYDDVMNAEPKVTQAISNDSNAV